VIYSNLGPIVYRFLRYRHI